MARDKKKKSRIIKVDFTDVEVRGNIPEDDYPLEVESVEQEESQAGNDYLKWTFNIHEGDFEGRKLYYNTTLQPQGLWNLRAVLEALGQEAPEGAMDLDLDELAGAKCIGTVEHETYEGKKQNRLVDFQPEESGGGKSSKEKDKPAGKGKKKDEPEKIKEDKVMEMDEDDLAELVKEHELDVDLDDHASIRKKRNAVVEALEAAELLEEA